ncbi:hypothetical protein ELG76_04200 [Rhizobium leguminosarum]|uniref:hypothetical protein n=1 Tax=Rhizobium leguminosarum TaxID=384 RepID=UPI00102F7A50|nr:hypothetical protein [Rhizobium leguminosarum]TBG78622.1 hypothetical protein ELG76_04200 [Rhizobium leguminosarum]
MAFNIMDLFGPIAQNRLLQPQQSAQGLPNMLLSRQPPQNYPVAGVPAAPAIDPQTVAAVQGPVAPMAAPAGPQMAQMAQMAQPGSAPEPFFNEDRKSYLNDLFTGWAAGSTPSESIAYGAKLTSANRKDRQGRNETISWLKSKGMTEEDAKRLASSPPALNEYLKNMYEQKKPLEVNGRLVDPTTYKVVADFSDPNAKMTSDQREFQQAKDDGFAGNFLDYQVMLKEAGRTKVDVNTGVKLPSGYEWIDPNNQEAGVRPIKGGPATQIPGELAARIGMGENFLKNDLPILRKEVEAGNATGLIDRGMAMAGYGKPAEVQRKFQSGVEVLSRLLSGAGMTQVEIDEKTKRYMPTMMDDPASVKTKLDQLEAEIKAAGNAAMRGRGETLEAAPSQEDPLGIR